MNPTRDAVIIGAGIIGLSVARKVARAGVRVTVIDRDEPGQHASWAAAGMLAPQKESEGPGPLLSLMLRSRVLFPAFVSELEAETGIAAGYRTEGMLRIALDEEDAVRLEARARWQLEAGLRVERLSGTEVRALEPAVAREALGALYFADDHQIDNRQLTRAIHASAINAGVEFRCGSGVRMIEARSGSICVKLENGEVIEAGTVVVAAGCWSGQIGGLPSPLPVEPVHGQLLALEMAPPALGYTLVSGDIYLVPRRDGRLLVGATSERVGFRRANTAGGMQRLTSAAVRLVPGLAERPVVSWWSGLRPATPDGLPVLGEDPAMPGVIYATGHYRNGILLAPVTGELVGGLVAGDGGGEELAPFGVGRFR
ncbi:MAG: glycine oxidase ThiO [Gemmatimonadota bacterium]|jgi:glycine oxidase|nr:glycine oxidase ThiO [Gemmatimonadota bacterium]